jgi:trans-2,3-dihydro-3-hydroxyanthranilate isomerase
MRRRYATVDVFTDRMFEGNPVAVVLDADGMATSQMQAIALEFNYVETTFVLPPHDPMHTANVRIFTPDREVPFAGHPNIGTAFVLARQMAARGEALPERFAFEEAAGVVRIDLLHEQDTVVGAELLSPEPLSRRSETPAARAAACLSLSEDDIRTNTHKPQVVSVGLPFLVVELASRGALRRARPDRQTYDDLFPLDGAKAVYAYTRDVGGEAHEGGCDLQARMFTWRLVEDPATGSATAALAALLAELGGKADARLRVGQGVDMGRPSLLLTHAHQQGGLMTAFVGGRCVAMFEGDFVLIGDERTDG